jgi:hypothetical protein
MLKSAARKYSNLEIIHVRRTVVDEKIVLRCVFIEKIIYVETNENHIQPAGGRCGADLIELNRLELRPRVVVNCGTA